MDRESILWASFLHDMGKLFQECRWLKPSPHDDPGSKGPLRQFLMGKPTQQKWFPGLFRDDFRSLVLLSYYCHDGNIEDGKTNGELDDSLLTYINIIARAHHLAGGQVPGDLEKREDTDVPVSRQRLIPIFSRVFPGKLKDTGSYFLPLVPIFEDRAVFPVLETGDRGDREEAFNTHLEGFLRELGKYMDSKEKPDFETFYYLAQKYLWCIPAFHENAGSAVSLFEHLKITAAIAAILYDCGTENIEEMKKGKNFSLVGFDISGIQEFIYTIASKGAAKSLKGRSFYLQLLEIAMAKYILEELHLPITNIVYNGGGKGFILAPAAKMALLPGIESHINRFLFREMRTQVYVGTAHENFGADGFNAFNLILERLARKLDKKKKQKFAPLLRQNYDLLFEPSAGKPGRLDSCSICGGEGDVEREEEGVRWCNQCHLFRELGTALRQAAAIRETLENCQPGAFSVPFAFGEKVYRYEFLSKQDLAEDQGHGDKGGILYFLNDTRLFAENFRGDSRTGYLFIAGNQVPVKDNSQEVMDFDDIALCSTGAKKLGVIRGDVDNLGLIFSRGLGQIASLGQISQLSFLLKHFFSSIANLVFKKENKEFIVYSGGDDFFVIGPWDRLIEDLVTFRQDFAGYTCFNPAFTFSASFSIFGGRYPAFKFAEVAGEQEKQAKDHQKDALEKNSLCFLDKVVFWEDFYRLKELADELVDLLNREVFNKSYIQLLQRIAQYNSLGRMKPQDHNELQQHARFHRWKWYYAWQAARLLERQKDKNQVKILLDRINYFLFSSVYKEDKKEYKFINNDSLYLIEIPARWAELKTRK